MDRMSLLALGAIALGGVLGNACYTTLALEGGGGNGQGAFGAGGGASNLPCDLAGVVASKCASCHGNPPAGAPVALVSYADLTAASMGDPALTEAELSVARMQAGTMPPGGGATAADIAAFQAFIDQGYPLGNCGAGGGGSDFNDPVGCATNRNVPKTGVGFDPDGSADMNPGLSCASCHNNNIADAFGVAGTVYAKAHDTDLCAGYDGSGGPAQIVIADANWNDVRTIGVGANGNFHSLVAPPAGFHVKLVYQGVERRMAASPDDLATNSPGDCNSCHTQDGTNGAPGRIKLP